MWYQQSPAVGDGLGWDLEAPHLSPKCSRHTWPPLQLVGSSGCSQPLSPDRVDHTSDRARRELTWVLLSLQCLTLPHTWGQGPSPSSSLWVGPSPHPGSPTQVLASLRSVRSNFSLLTNVPIPSNK